MRMPRISKPKSKHYNFLNISPNIFPPNKMWHIFALLAACLTGLIFISLNWIGIIDDAYIFFRYAYNLSHGYGYVFNVGHPIEGTTSVTWTLLLAVLDIFHIPAEISVKMLGGICLIAILVLIAIEGYKTNLPTGIIFLIYALLIF
jgi:hypothetical protein